MTAHGGVARTTTQVVDFEGERKPRFSLVVLTDAVLSTGQSAQAADCPAHAIATASGALAPG